MASQRVHRTARTSVSAYGHTGGQARQRQERGAGAPSVCPTRHRVPFADRAVPGRTGQTPHIHAASSRWLRFQKVSPTRSSLTALRSLPPTRGSQCSTSCTNHTNQKQPRILSGRVCEARGCPVINSSPAPQPPLFFSTGNITYHTERTLTRNVTTKGETRLFLKRLLSATRVTQNTNGTFCERERKVQLPTGVTWFLVAWQLSRGTRGLTRHPWLSGGRYQLGFALCSPGTGHRAKSTANTQTTQHPGVVSSRTDQPRNQGR